MQSAIVAFAFGVLLFFASSAALASEPSVQALGFGHLTLLMLATLQTLTTFLVTAGPSSLVEREWVLVVACATASVAASVLTVVVAMNLANAVHLEVSPDGGVLVLFLVLFGGVALLVQHAYCSVAVIPDRTSE